MNHYQVSSLHRIKVDGVEWDENISACNKLAHSIPSHPMGFIVDFIRSYSIVVKIFDILFSLS